MTICGNAWRVFLSCADTTFLIWVSGWISLRLPDLYKKIFRFVCRPCLTTVYRSMHWAKREEWKTFQIDQGVPDLFLQSNIFRHYLRGTEVFLSQIKTLCKILDVSQSFFPIGCARKSSRKMNPEPPQSYSLSLFIWLLLYKEAVALLWAHSISQALLSHPVGELISTASIHRSHPFSFYQSVMVLPPITAYANLTGCPSNANKTVSSAKIRGWSWCPILNECPQYFFWFGKQPKNEKTNQTT